jgi:hypothetical protein
MQSGVLLAQVGAQGHQVENGEGAPVEPGDLKRAAGPQELLQEIERQAGRLRAAHGVDADAALLLYAVPQQRIDLPIGILVRGRDPRIVEKDVSNLPDAPFADLVSDAICQRYLPAELRSPSQMSANYRFLCSGRCSSCWKMSPWDTPVVLEEDAVNRCAGLSLHDGVVDTGGAVDDVQWRAPSSGGVPFPGMEGFFVGDPAGVDAACVNAAGGQIGGAGAGEHIQGGFGHVGVRVVAGLATDGELAFDGGYVDQVAV